MLTLQSYSSLVTEQSTSGDTEYVDIGLGFIVWIGGLEDLTS
jgi:hypothetical protein